MKPYNENPVCAKCGCKGASTEYQHDTPAFLLRRCARCGYSWREAPLDTGKPPEPEGKEKFFGNHIESKDAHAICLCGEQVVEWLTAGSILPAAVYRCPRAINKKAG